MLTIQLKCQLDITWLPINPIIRISIEYKTLLIDRKHFAVSLMQVEHQVMQICKYGQEVLRHSNR